MARQVVLTWTDTSNNEDGFTIERKDVACSTPGPFTAIGSVGPNITTYTDPASPLPYACYRVKATSATLGDSGYSNEALASVPQHGGQRRGLRR